NRLRRAERAKKERLALNAALHARGIRVRTTDKPPDLEDAEICLKPDPLSPATSQLHFPLLLLYPIHAQSDFLKSVNETSTVADICATVLAEPMQWDQEGEYVCNSDVDDGGKGVVKCFVETRKGGMMKVGRKVRVLDVVAGGKCEVVDGVVRVFVVPSARVSGWVEEMKRLRGKS
ncbi:MAG: hypothetical protein Q9181_002713, partial [Wetmoreana brouardii]